MTQPTAFPEFTAATDFPKYFDALIFDCDGTLTDSMPLHYLAWREAMEACGIDFPEARFYEFGGMPSERIISILAREQAVEVDVDQAAQQKEKLFEKHLVDLCPIPAVCDIARKHHGVLPMAVASGGIRPIIDAQLKRIDLRHLFDVVVTAEDTVKHKPDPDVFLEAAARMQIAPDRCLVFEDSGLGFQAAERASMRWIDVRPWHEKR